MAFDAFIKIGDIKGESTDSKHIDWIEVLGYEHSAVQPSGGSQSGSGAFAAGRVELSRFKITKAIDLATPVIYNYCSMNTNIPEVEMQLCRATGNKEVYYRVILNDAKIAGITTKGIAKGAQSSPLPTETVEIGFSKIQWEYTATDHKTGVQGGVTSSEWDVTANA